MEDSTMRKRVMREKIYTRRKTGRRKAQDRDQWRRIAQEAKAHVGL
jgi:hypothetical protein